MITTQAHGRAGHIEDVLLDDEDAATAQRYMRLKNGYALIRQCQAGHRREVPVHRIILGLTPHDGREVDHINRNRLDNRRSNLRIVAREENAQNQGVHRRWRFADKPAYRGVHWIAQSGRWRASVQQGGKEIARRVFDNPEEAAEWVAEQRKTLFPFTVEGEGGANSFEGARPAGRGLPRFSAVRVSGRGG